ncbi:MAG: hypothetical protein JNL11_16515 [Bdellovibrionaceae bacterium]|nr:hypothetical protein [Pseudobdellovibrionaceae bacterium]
MKLIPIVLMLFISIRSFSQVYLGLNDLTHLLPLPATDHISALLHPRSNGPRGELLPYTLYQKLPRMVPNLDPLMLYQQSWKVIAIRLDPCFVETAPARSCQPQIRLVWQPLLVKEYSVGTIDATLQTFYNLTATEWQALIQQYAQLKNARVRNVRSAQALQVSPQLLNSGYQGAYWKGFSQLVLNYAGTQNLARLTFMNVNAMGNMWVFAGYNIQNGMMGLMKIPGIDKNSQVVSATRLGSPEVFLSVVPTPTGSEHYFNFSKNSEVAKRTWSPDLIQAATKSAIELENPRRHNSATVSCASCHMTRSVSMLTRGSFPSWNWGQILQGIVYVGSTDATNTTLSFLRGDSLRMLGYFDRTPVISDRVIHETDLSLRFMGAASKVSNLCTRNPGGC